MFGRALPGVVARALAAVSAFGGLAAAANAVDSTVLVVARNDDDAAKAGLGLDGYGIPWEKVLVAQTGSPLPALNSSGTQGRFGAIVVIGGVSYDMGGGRFASALTDQQWNDMFAYQTAFRVRMVRLDEFPGPAFGATPAVANTGCCDSGQEQLVSITKTDAFPGANLKSNAGVSTKGLFHYPAKITDTANTTEVASFDPAGAFTTKSTAAVINAVNGREQMAWFISWAPDWSPTSSYLQHAYIHWMTRSLFVGKRKVHLSPQIDDVHLDTDLYRPVNTTFRLRPADLQAHVDWQKRLNTRLPAGSDVRLELGHNGNGDIISAISKPAAATRCKPNAVVDYESPPDAPPDQLEFKKPPGTGVDLWGAQFTQYAWSKECAQLDDLASWFLPKGNLDAFAHVSHTFSHEELNNATYNDASREISFNQAWLKQLGIDRAQRFSPQGIIPPAVTGLHNADAIKAWTDNGIKNVFGDNTRPVLRNAQSRFWALPSNVETNGREGILIMPRFATTIYYNCDKPDCTLQEWKDTSAGHGEFKDLLDDARATNTRYLLGLQADPYMFHQANMRQIDMDTMTVGSETGKLSLVMSWVETVTQEMYRLTNWPMTSLKHDDLATYFTSRMALDACKPKASYSYSDDGRSIVSVTVTTSGNSCSAPVPVTLPGGAATADGGAPKTDKVGSEPPIMWLTLSGKPVTLRLQTPIKV